MSPDRSGLVTWFWEWVPTAAACDDERAAWTAHVVDLVDGWAGTELAIARSAVPQDSPFTAAALGGATAAGLLDRAAALPGWARLAWGATFLDGRVRWSPNPVVAEFRRPAAADPAYLMETVGAGGFDDDVREPVVDYVSTEAGDGVVVFALAGGGPDPVHGRLDAALRLAVPDAEVDVVLRTVVFDLAQMAVIASGVETLMHLIAGDSGLRFITPAPVQERAS